MTKPLKRQFRELFAIGYCPTIGPSGKRKRSYPTKSAAKRAMKAANKTEARTATARKQTMVYECREPGCGAWHTSSIGSH